LHLRECACLSGPSGSGKSRLLRAIADLDPHEGSSVLDGRSCSDFPPQQWRLEVGLLPPQSAWWAELTRDHFSDPSPELLSDLGLAAALLDRPVRLLSSGEKQRFALLRLLANRPTVLLLDEPTANLDPESTERVEKLVRQYLDQTPATALWVSHDAEQVGRIGSRCLRMSAGKLDDAAR
jgi:ABC-type iron transport system FetAB ATPase subunit